MLDEVDIMNVDTINVYIKIFFIILYTYYTYFKIINRKCEKINYILLICIDIILSLIYVILKNCTNIVLEFLILYCLLCCVMAFFTKVKLGYSTMITVISLSITIVALVISVVIFFPLNNLIAINDMSKVIGMILIAMMQGIIVINFFKIKRIKKRILFYTE